MKKAAREKREVERMSKKAEEGENVKKSDDYDYEKAAMERKAKKLAEKEMFLSKCSDNFKVIIDCSFEEEHSDNGLRSLTQQIMYAYGVNRRSVKPCYMYITGVGDATQNKLAKTHTENWLATTVHREPYQDVVKDKKLVYLTADSPHTITSLDENCAYIIGGIVDRNSLKGITYKKALEENIETAKLPLDECVKMMGNSKTKVLTVNHVFEILMKYAENKSWLDAFETTLPERKDIVAVARKEEQQDKSITKLTVTEAASDNDNKTEK